MPELPRRSFLRLSGAAAASLLLPGVTETAGRKKTPTYISDVDKAVHEHIVNLRRQGTLSARDETSVLVYGLNSNSHFVKINVDEQRIAASLIKPFAMLAAYHVVANGKTPYEGLERDIRAMIVNSDNPATNRVMRFAGGPRQVQRICQQYGFTKTMVSEYIPASGKTYSNKTTSRNLNYLLWQLHNGKAISPVYSAKMLSHLDAYSTSRLTELEGELKVENLAGKTGFVGGLNGEATRVTFNTPTGPSHYTFIAMIENPRMTRASQRKKHAWGKKTSDVIRDIFRVVHKHMAKP